MCPLVELAEWNLPGQDERILITEIVSDHSHYLLDFYLFVRPAALPLRGPAMQIAGSGRTKMADQAKTILRALSERPVAYHPAYARITGSAKAGLLLSQAMYWTGVCSELGRNGWFYKSHAEWSAETGLSSQEIRTARDTLKSLGILEEDLRRVPATLHYRINETRLVELLLQFADNHKLDCGRPQTISETTNRDTGDIQTKKLEEEGLGPCSPVSENLSIGFGATEASCECCPEVDGVNVVVARLDILAQLNVQSRAVGLYDFVAPRIGDALRFARTEISDEPVEGSPYTRRDTAYTALGAIRKKPAPVYLLTGDTPRLTMDGMSWQNLNGDLRNILLAGSVKLDLVAAQFAINAWLWNEPSILDLAGSDVWVTLGREIGLEQKNDLKPLVYGTSYGQTWTTARNYLMEKLALTESVAAERMRRSSLLSKLFSARDKFAARIKHSGGAKDAFGKWISASDDDQVRSCMAQVSQSWEVWLMLPVLAELMDSEVPILALIHDGLYVPEGTPESLIQRAQAVLCRRALGLGIRTVLGRSVVTSPFSPAPFANT